MSRSFRSLALGGSLLATAVGISSAHAAIFVNQQLTECLSVFFGGNESQAFLSPCTASFSQMWNWEEIEIRGLGTTNLALKCLDVRGAGTANNTPVQLFTCNGTVAQRWFYTASGQILNPPSGKCLDLSANEQVVIVTCDLSKLSQQWAIQ
jgi:hypothetical protein